MNRTHSPRSHGQVQVLLRSKTRTGAASHGPDQRKLIISSDGGSCLIGRASRNTTKNLQPQSDNALFECAVMSRSHALIIVPNGIRGPVLLQDTNSMHGVYVNGEQVKSVEIVDGDVIRFGASVSRLESVHDGVEVEVSAILRTPLSSTGKNETPLRTAKTPTTTYEVPEESDSDAAPDAQPPRSGQSKPEGLSAQNPVVLDDDEAERFRISNRLDVLRAASSPIHYEELDEDANSLFGSESEGLADEHDRDMEALMSEDEDDILSGGDHSPVPSDTPASDSDQDDDEQVDEHESESESEPEQVDETDHIPSPPVKIVGDTGSSPVASKSHLTSGMPNPWDNAHPEKATDTPSRANLLPSIDTMTSNMPFPKPETQHSSNLFPYSKTFGAPSIFARLDTYATSPHVRNSSTYHPGDTSFLTRATDMVQRDSTKFTASIPSLLGSSPHRPWTTEFGDEYQPNRAFEDLFKHANPGVENNNVHGKQTGQTANVDTWDYAFGRPSSATLPPATRPQPLSTMTLAESSPPVTTTATELPAAEDGEESKGDGVVAEDSTSVVAKEVFTAAEPVESTQAELIEGVTASDNNAVSPEKAGEKRKRAVEDDGREDDVRPDDVEAGAVQQQDGRPTKAPRRQRRQRVRTNQMLVGAGGLVGGFAAAVGLLMMPQFESLMATWPEF